MVNLRNTEILDWLYSRESLFNVDVQKIGFSEMEDWSIETETGCISHKSGKFFSIQGIRVSTNWGGVNHWDQPIINQPEIGILGIIAKEFNGTIYYLLQAKIEPGNIGTIQLSPTLQATKSNYTKVHKGKTPDYLEYFLSNKKNIVIDQLQSEQGARFLHKRNRNIIILVEEDVEHNDNFFWMTLDEIKNLMRQDNVVNMDTRSVIAGLNIRNQIYPSYNRYDKQRGEMFSLNEILSWIADQKSRYEIDVRRTSLSNIDSWIVSDYDIHHREDKYFKVIAAKVQIAGREVSKWTQPMVESAQEGLIAFVVKRINGVIHFLVQAKVEAGNLDIIELAPTVQCLTGNYRDVGDAKLPYLDFVLSAQDSQIILDTLQSEEGGRFYREQNRNIIVFADDNFQTDLPSNYIWMTYDQLQLFIMFNNYINIQARSLLAAIKKCDDEIY